MGISLTGNDTIVLNDRVFADFADGDVAAITFPNELASVKTGKNGNSIYAQNLTGLQGQFVLRLLMGSEDDKFLNNLWVAQQNSFAEFVLLNGQFVKKVGDGAGNLQSIIYDASGGVFTKGIEAKTSVEGDTEQSVAVYTMMFSLAKRSIS